MNLTERARILFARDLYATRQTGINIDLVETDHAVCSVALNEDHRNAKGAVMGGVLFTLADYAFAIAVHSDILASTDDVEQAQLQWVSTSATINFISGTKGEKLIASSNCVKKGRTQAFFLTTVTDDLGKTISTISTIGTRIMQ